MTKSEVLELITANIKMPVQQQWKPSKWDLERATTPARCRKLAALEERENLKLLNQFEAEMKSYNSIFAVVDEIDTYPDEIKDLFFSTFSWTIDNLVKRHEAYLKTAEALKKIAGENSISIANTIRYYMFKKTWEWTGSRNITREIKSYITAEDLPREYIHCSCHPAGYFDQALASWEDFRSACYCYYEAKDLDSLATCSDPKDAYTEAMIGMASTLSKILSEIKERFNGNKPSQCLTDASWGAKGEFCGVLTDGLKKISFKSFAAGGWNIQRYHFRFKITELKK